jgi:hypothetical protein
MAQKPEGSEPTLAASKLKTNRLKKKDDSKKTPRLKVEALRRRNDTHEVKPNAQSALIQ